MAEKKRPNQKFVTPAGEAKYPWIDKPDTKFNKGGVYKCDVALEDNEATRKLIDRLESIRDEHFDSLDAKKRKTHKKADVYEEELDDAGEETGRLIIKTKMNATIEKKDGETFKQSPNVFDCSKPPKLLKGVNVWSGSVVKVAGEVVPYDMGSTKLVGVSLRMKGVQVITLVSGQGADAASYGFSEEDGGFQVEESEGDSDFDNDVGNTPSDDEF